ncbi:haloacid dehalogenase type II [Arthrobacter sp. AL08]|uniref:haloacid dehalogenase type II n=1 Tax=Micrococcaceae TaxID=1268 RepID=UPI001CFFB5B2|nr:MULTISPECIES: haloacid dehalogenase type II [Micrococcaceae]MCB5280795.1 Haloacetate dehalogenase H-2 [Arthrobacter sp. ES1]MDI3240842.1 haloacid dehalogenase type II [Arthrobacter sp. AL05]MDI3277182.1 haloacid dehalogenase type II [Arthrobacter sp. AL08]MDJ0352431.1 haloacid dehalogenase type II [Pseudarthrobacter sp. PH31-O2]WGZ79492.1 haloacid dehalogenase type II [Arthrobacter sp. EM1]
MTTAISVIVFDVNETLSDMSAMGGQFSDVGAPAELAKLWFATLLRDGFALTASGDNGSFAAIGAEALRGLLTGVELNRPMDAAVDHVMAGLTGLKVHPDVPAGITVLAAAGFRLITLSNGSARIAAKLFSGAGIRDEFEALLSVEDAPAWKPARSSYDYAAAASGAAPADMLLVAVHPWDIHGAARAGLRTAWLNRSGSSYPGYFESPDFTVNALTELPGVLAAAH